MRRGLKLGLLEVHRSKANSPGDTDPEERERFAIAESQVLLHHAAETLLRLYLGHEGLPPCPWLEIVRVRTPGQFKSLLNKRFEGNLDIEERRRRVAAAFHGSASRESFNPVPPEEKWNAANDNVEAFLGHFARLVVEDSGLYNSAKHGLTILVGERSMSLGDGKVVSAAGKAVSYLDMRREGPGAPRWAMATSWAEVDRSLGFVQMATLLIDTLWSVARARYVAHPLDRVRLLDSPPYKALLPREGIIVDRVQMDLLYYVDVSGRAVRATGLRRSSPAQARDRRE